MAKNGYTTLNLPTALVEELKVWRMAFGNACGKQISYGEIIRGMLDSLKDTNPGVVEEFGLIVKKHPELIEKLCYYQGKANDE